MNKVYISQRTLDSHVYYIEINGNYVGMVEFIDTGKMKWLFKSDGSGLSLIEASDRLISYNLWDDIIRAFDINEYELEFSYFAHTKIRNIWPGLQSTRTNRVVNETTEQPTSVEDQIFDIWMKK